MRERHRSGWPIDGVVSPQRESGHQKRWRGASAVGREGGRGACDSHHARGLTGVQKTAEGAGMPWSHHGGHPSGRRPGSTARRGCDTALRHHTHPKKGGPDRHSFPPPARCVRWPWKDERRRRTSGCPKSSARGGRRGPAAARKSQRPRGGNDASSRRLLQRSRRLLRVTHAWWVAGIRARAPVTHMHQKTKKTWTEVPEKHANSDISSHGQPVQRLHEDRVCEAEACNR